MHGDAKEKADIDTEKEIVETSTIQAMGQNKFGNIEQIELQEKLDNNAGTGKTEAIDNGDTIIVKFIDSNRYYEIGTDGNVQYIDAKTAKTLTIKCYDSPTNVIKEQRYIVIGSTYSKELPKIEGYESEQEKVEGSISDDTTLEVKYYKICNDDTTLIFRGVNSSGNETTNNSEIVSYKVTGINASVDSSTYLSIQIPDKYKNLQVTMLTNTDFSKKDNIYKVIIPDTITKYGDDIFSGDTNLKYAEINGSGGGYYNFRGCTNLEKVVLGDGLSLSLQWFSGCTNLKEVILNGEITMGERAFENCNKLDTITLAEGNKNYKVIEDILYSYDETKLICVLPKKQGEYIIPKSVSEIKGSAVNCTRNN